MATGRIRLGTILLWINLIILLLPLGLCLVGEAVTRRTLQRVALLNQMLSPAGPWFWYGTLGLICVTAGVGLMVESGLLRGYPRNAR